VSRWLLRYPTITALLITLLWGNAFVGIKYALETLTPVQFLLARFIPAAVWLGLMAARDWPTWGRVLRDHWRPLAFLGVIFIWGYHLLLNMGETTILPGLAALIVATSPVFVFLFGLLLREETPTAEKLIGLALAMAGLYLSVVFSDQAIGLSKAGVAQRAYNLGILATFGTCLSWAVYTRGVKSLARQADPFVLTGWVMILGTLPSLFLIDRPFVSALAGASVQFWLALAYLSLIAAVWAVLWWSKLLQHADATTLSAFIYLVPVWSHLFSFLYYGERFTPLSGLGMGLILGGLWVLNAKRPPPPQLAGSKGPPICGTALAWMEQLERERAEAEARAVKDSGA